MRAVAALKADKAKALDEFNNGTGGFLQGDLYVFCANASDGKIVALANPNAKQLIGTDQRNLERAHRQGIRQGIIRCGTEARRTNY